MKLMYKSTALKQAMFLVFTVILILAAAFNFRWVIEFGITPLALGLIFSVLGTFALFRSSNDKKLEQSIPKSLRTTSQVFLIVLSLYFVVAMVLLLFSDYELDFEDVLAFAMLGVISLSVWGTVIFVVIILPIWALAQWATAKNSKH